MFNESYLIMIPLLTIDTEFVNKNWESKEDIDFVMNHCDVVYAKDHTIPLYYCDDNWVNMGVFKEYKKTVPISDFFESEYCDTEDALIKYLQQYVNDKENSYFVKVGSMSMEYDKYYKEGSYINKDGEDTGDDYYSYIEQHPEMEVEQDFENQWYTFNIFKLKK